MSDFVAESSDIAPGDDAGFEAEPEQGSEVYAEQPEAGGEAGEPDPNEPVFTVRVNGEDIEVRQSELLSGYQRQADYTQKTQALAAQRKDLQDAQALLSALQRNPQQTLQVLMQAYGFNVDGTAVAGQETEQEFLTPEEQRIHRLESWQNQELARQREAQIDATISRLHQGYGEFSDDELFSYAVNHNVMDLETALRAMQYEQLVEQQARGTQARRSEKRAAGAMANGNGRNGAVPRNDDGEIKTVEDAWAAAKRQLNL